MSEDEVPRGDSSDYDEGGDSWDEEEDLKDYRKGGYHPVKINDKFSSDRYRVMSKLGWGHFSTVWLAWDSLGKKAVVIKIQKSASRYQEAARDEVTLLKQVSGSRDAKRQCLVMLEDHFVHKGINGTHHVMAFEVLGPTLLSLIKQTGYHGLPLAVVRRLAVCTLVALRHLHEELSIIHTDLKPENILCCYTEKELHALIERARAEADETGRRQAEAAAAAAAAGDGDAGGKGAHAEAGGGALSKAQKRRMKEKEKKKQAAALAAAASNGEAGEVAGAMAGGGDDDEEDDEAEPAAVPPPPSGSSGGRGGKHEPRLRQHRTPPTELDASAMLFKVVDLGNACWRDRHFTADIQTRQYRCPEVILGAGYDTSADMWSVACVLFEAATGDMLFAPKAGQSWSRDEDHMALIMELVGRMPKKLALAGKHSKEFFNQKGELRNIKDLRMWPLESVLHKKYEFDEVVANPFASFCLPMLDLNPARRATAAEMLKHKWLKQDEMAVQRRAEDRVANGEPAEEEDDDEDEEADVPVEVSTGGGTGGGLPTAGAAETAAAAAAAAAASTSTSLAAEMASDSEGKSGGGSGMVTHGGTTAKYGRIEAHYYY